VDVPKHRQQHSLKCSHFWLCSRNIKILVGIHFKILNELLYVAM
jgi:hypothetical protein